MHLLRYAVYAAAAGAAGVALALAAGQDPARADDPDGLVTGTVNSLLDPLAGKRKKDRPTPVRDTLTKTTTVVDKTVGKTLDTTTGAVKTVTDTVDKVVEPLPVVGKTVDRVTDTTDRTLDAVTKPRTSPQPAPSLDLDNTPAPAEPNPTPGGKPDQPAPAAPKPTPDITRTGTPKTAPEPERRSPTRHAGSGAHHLPWQTPTNHAPAPAAAPVAVADTTDSTVRDQPHQPADSPDMGADSLTPTSPPTPPDGALADTPTYPNLRHQSPADTSTHPRGRHHPPTAPSG